MANKISRRLVTEKMVDMLEHGKSPQHVVQVLAAHLVENGVTRQSELYLRDIRQILERRFSLVSAEVATAHKLNDKLIKDIEQYIIEQTGAKEVETINTVNQDLISGVVISTTSAEYDGSLRNKIKKLKAV